MTTEVVILAAGQGTRMRSSLPKILHPLAGKAMLGHVIAAAEPVATDKLQVVVGHGAEQVQAAFASERLNWVLQSEQKGTGHAVQQALPALAEDAVVLILYGDVPLIATDTLQRLADCCSATSLGLLTTTMDDPHGYGRILRDKSGKVTAIVEQKDATDEQRRICEINTGMMAVSARHLREWLPMLGNSNAQGEYYLTDIIEIAVAEGVGIDVVQPNSNWEVQGVNDRRQLNTLERYYQQRQAERLMSEGVSLADAARIDVRGELSVGNDSFIDVNCVFEGSNRIGANATIGPNCQLINCTVGSAVTIKANSVLEDAVVGDDCDIGPFARLRPGTMLADKAKVGNFVETKKATIGEGSKVNHLTYIGDAEIGKNVNVGAGTITCNYDGANKHRTRIADGAFIGSNTALVAPVTVGKDATVGAGSTITNDIPDEELGVARGKQRNISGWKRPTKNPEQE